MLIINKNTKKINESVTKLSDIQNYGKSWTTEHQPEDFINMLNSFLNGTLKGLTENKRVYSRNREDDIIEMIDDDIKLINQIKEIIKDK